MSKVIKVLVLSHISELLGGAERSMLDVFDYLSKEYGVQPEFILREPVKSLVPAIKKRGWKYHALDYTFWSNSKPLTSVDDIAYNLKRNQKAISSIEKIIKTTRPDIVVTNSVVCPWAALAAHNQQVPHVWFVREYGDLDHGRVYEIGRKKTLEDVGNLSELVVTISEALERHLASYISRDKLTVLYNPFNLKQIEKGAEIKVKSPYHDSSSLKLIITGNLAKSKGQLEAIEAVGLLNKVGHNTELCIIGSDTDKTYMAKLMQQIEEYNVEDKVHILGYKTNPLAYVSLADVGIMSSRMEGFGRVTFEYLVLGKPVVGANTGATPEMVGNGKNGYLFDPDDKRSLVNALENYVKDKSLIKTHGKNSRTKALQMMQGSHNIDNLFKKIERVASEKNVKKTEPINYFAYMKQQKSTLKSSLTIKRRAYKSLKRHAKRAYFKGRSIKTKLLGS